MEEVGATLNWGFFPGIVWKQSSRCWGTEQTICNINQYMDILENRPLLKGYSTKNTNTKIGK